MKKKILKFLNIVFLILGFAILFFIGQKIGWEVILEKSMSIHIGGFIIILILPLVWIFLHSFGWFLLLDDRKKFRFRNFFGAQISSTAVSEILPMGQASGEPYRILYVRRKYSGEHSPNIIASIILYNTIHSFATGLLITSGFFLILTLLNVGFYKKIIAIGMIVLGFAVLFYFIQKQKKGLLAAVFSIMGKFKIFKKFVERKKDKADQVDTRLKKFYQSHRSTFYLALIIIFIAKIMGAVEFYIIMYFINEPISFLTAVIVFAGNSVVQLLFFFFPAQIGASEGSIVYLFSVLGKSTVSGITLALFRRIRVLAWTLVGFIIAYLYGPKMKLLDKKKDE
ncbi:MAG TPA: hypothetical protein DHW82_11890 [Spirochaetia bacterium]|nr:MAG: hypothetical protein A2Y41_12430 [Spirochaetes bacterium GWB1_36_13]HCL57692.1 hypothetical protein [Spirochaetia bacterium]